MKQIPYQNNIPRCSAAGLLILALSAAGPAFSQSQDAGVQGIVKQWAAIEARFVEANFVEASFVETSFIETNFINDQQEAQDALLKEVDEFLNAIQSFLDSETYRIYRLIPFSQPNEIAEIQEAATLALVFRQAALNGDRQTAMLVSNHISAALVQALIQDGEMERFATAGYFRLLLVFLFFIILTACIIRYLYKTLTRTIGRAAESADFSRAVLLAQEKERSRLYRELHDTIAQDLRGMSLGMEKIGLCPDTEQRLKLCTETASIQSDLIRKVRDICNFLVPPDFRFQGLGDALRRLCLDFGKRTGIDCRISITKNVNTEFFDEEKQLQIFRIVQEALSNVEKHAGAAEAIVIVRHDTDGNLTIGISDDGKGFIPPAGNASYDNGAYTDIHFGIRSMNERAALLGGSLKIKSEPGEGTLVRLELPSH